MEKIEATEIERGGIKMKYFVLPYILVNIICFTLYGIDKRRAINGTYRISEKTLLLWAFFGPIGGILGMQHFRHKTQKLKFKLLVPGFLALQLAVGAFATTTVYGAELSKPSPWALHEFNQAIEKGYTTEAMLKNLQSEITREDFVDLIMTSYEKLMGEIDGITIEDNPFADTDNLNVIKASKLEIVNGQNGYFNPTANLTREEMIVMFIRVSQAIELRSDVSLLPETKDAISILDEVDISDWAKESVYLAVANGMVAGNGDGTVDPKGTSTKEQAVLLNFRLFERFEDNDSLNDYIDAFVTTEDNTLSEEATIAVETGLIKTGYVTCDILNMRSAPDLSDSGNIIKKLRMNTILTIHSATGNWYEVSTQAGLKGYVYQDYVLEYVPSKSASGKASDVIEYAKKFIGTPYRYGGTSLTSGTDCSSFTQQVMAPFGVSLPRSSSSQYGVGQTVAKSDLQPGDLVFYGYSGRVSHVAMYIGDGQVIHATTTSGVRITSAFGWMHKPFIGAKRVLR